MPCASRRLGVCRVQAKGLAYAVCKPKAWRMPCVGFGGDCALHPKNCYAVSMSFRARSCRLRSREIFLFGKEKISPLRASFLGAAVEMT